MLQIMFKDGGSRTYKDDSFTDFEYMKDVFVVLKDVKWIGIYSMDCIKFVEYFEN